MRSIVFSCTYAVVVSILAWVVASEAPVQAEPRHTVEPVALRKKPGEQAPVVARLPANTEVTVLGTDGRWLRVRGQVHAERAEPDPEIGADRELMRPSRHPVIGARWFESAEVGAGDRHRRPAVVDRP